VLLSASAEAFAHPTEDRARVLQALNSIVPAEYEETVAEGEFGESMLILAGTCSGQAAARAAARVKGLVYRFDEDGRAVFMLDKQAAFAGKAANGKGIKLVFRFSSYPFSLETVRQEAGGLLGIL